MTIVGTRVKRLCKKRTNTASTRSNNNPLLLDLRLIHWFQKERREKMTSTHHFSFGDLKVGEKFVFFNPFYHAKVDFQQEQMTKLSARRYKDARGCIWHCPSKTGVARVPSPLSLEK